MDVLNAVVAKVISWIDRIFGYGDFYTGRYSRIIIYIFLILGLSKLIKVKANVTAGGGSKK